MTTHGGIRTGAGRKTLEPGERRVQIAAKVAPETIKALESARRDGESLGKLLDRLIAAGVR